MGNDSQPHQYALHGNDVRSNCREMQWWTMDMKSNTGKVIKCEARDESEKDMRFPWEFVEISNDKE